MCVLRIHLMDQARTLLSLAAIGTIGYASVLWYYRHLQELDAQAQGLEQRLNLRAGLIKLAIEYKPVLVHAGSPIYRHKMNIINQISALGRLIGEEEAEKQDRQLGY